VKITEHSGGYQDYPIHDTGISHQKYFNSLSDLFDNRTLIWGLQPSIELRSLYKVIRWNFADFIASDVD
jgi:hypothetical protein